MSKDNVYAYSTASQTIGFAFYKPKSNPNSLHEIEHTIYIKGGANVATKTLTTPLGVVTKLSIEDYQALTRGLRGEGMHRVFKHCLDAGFITVESFKEKANTVAKDMTPRDSSAPSTEKDLKKQGLTLLRE